MIWEKTGSELREELLAAIHEEIGRRPVTMTEVMEAAGLFRCFLAQARRRGEDVGIEEVLDILAALDLRPSWFFTVVLDDYPPPECFLLGLPVDLRKPDRRLLAMEAALAEELDRDGPQGEPPRVADPAAAARKLAGMEPSEQLRALGKTRRYRHPAVARAYLARLDEERYDRTELAARLAEGVATRLVPRVPGPCEERLALHCSALGVFASARRLLGDFGSACRALEVALGCAREHELDFARAELLRRATYLLADHAQYDAALRVIREARSIYALDGGEAEEVPAAIATVDEGYVRFYRGELERAERLFDQALDRLHGRAGAGVWRVRLNALLNLALVARESGRFDTAERQLARAAGLLGDQHDACAAKVFWLQGTLAFAQGRRDRAEELLRTAFEIFEARCHTDLAVAGVDLVEVLLAKGEKLQAQVVGTRIDELARRHPRNEILRSCAGALARALLADEVTAPFLDKLRNRLRGALPLERRTTGRRP